MTSRKMAPVLGTNLVPLQQPDLFPAPTCLPPRGRTRRAMGLIATEPITPAQIIQILLSRLPTKSLTRAPATRSVSPTAGPRVAHSKLTLIGTPPSSKQRSLILLMTNSTPRVLTVVSRLATPTTPRPHVLVRFPLVATIRQFPCSLEFLCRGCALKNLALVLGEILRTPVRLLRTTKKKGLAPPRLSWVPRSPEDDITHTVPATPTALPTDPTSFRTLSVPVTACSLEPAHRAKHTPSKCTVEYSVVPDPTDDTSVGPGKTSK